MTALVTSQLNAFLLGAICTAAAAIGLLFLRAHRRTGDRLFVAFALAFWMLTLNFLGLAFIPSDQALRPAVYLLRVAAFGLIIFAIIDKNRSAGPPRPPAPGTGPRRAVRPPRPPP